MKRRIFLVCLFYFFLDCRSTNLLRLFSGNLPAMLFRTALKAALSNLNRFMCRIRRENIFYCKKLQVIRHDAEESALWWN